MKRLWKMTMGIGALGAVVLMSGYFLDHHRCKRINYEQAGYELPSTWLMSAKQCFNVAHSVKLRSYARNL